MLALPKFKTVKISINNAVKFCRTIIFKEMIKIKSPLSEEYLKYWEKLGENNKIIF